LIRHGQYLPSDETLGGQLTSLGREQARRTASRLKGLAVATIHSSDMPRAIETAEIIARELGRAKVAQSAMLRERVPTGIPGKHVPLGKRREAREAIDFIVERFFCAAPRARHDIIVCHGNLIRALVCCALGARLGAWRKMDVHNGGITRLLVREDGSLRVTSFNDTGHLRGELLTES
jgi:broad specificity phosphatase PhoE